MKDGDPQAYKGLITLYEKQGSEKLGDYHDTVLRLALIYAEKEDAEQCQAVVDKYEFSAKKNGSRVQYIHALELILPSSPLYNCLEGRVMSPYHTYSRIIEATEIEEKEWINREIGERRTRLGARIENVTLEVKREAYSRFQLEQIYAQAIDWTTDDEVRRVLEEKHFQRAFDTLTALPQESKPDKRDQVMNLAKGMVIVKHQFHLAWVVALEWVNTEYLGDWDVNIFKEYIDFFPENGFSKVLRGFLESDICPFPKQILPNEESKEIPETPEIPQADRLILMVEGLEDCQDSFLGHRIMAEIYLSIGEFESAVETGRKAQEICQKVQKSFALNLQDSSDAVNMTLATALISYQSPRYHPEATGIFNDILSRKPKSTSALLGVGLILEEDEDYDAAVGFLDKAYQRDPTNVRVKGELAWCKAQAHGLDNGLQELRDTLESIESSRPVSLSMKSEALYRIGHCVWEQDSSKAARKNKEGAYRYFVDSIKANPEYAPAYTKLGIYFEQYSKNKNRARTAFHKAFELSSSEIEAAAHLARNFADGAEWDLVELVAQRVVDSGKARPAPGSKKKAHSWPYAALGTVQVNKQQYSKAIVSFQAALRIAPTDYNSWVGLGESYHHSGRYVAATKTLQRAEALENKPSAEQTWFAKYMLANICRERALFEDAINGYEAVLQIKPAEYGVSIALLQTLAESAWGNVEAGILGQAASKATRAIEVACDISSSAGKAFNLWKSVGDACAVFSMAQRYASKVDFQKLSTLLNEQSSPSQLDLLSDIDKVTFEVFQSEVENSSVNLSDLCLLATILSHKRAIFAAADDHHAHAVSWYNLGWAEFKSHATASPKLLGKSRKQSGRFLKCSMRCFKRAIELEAGNSDFWNALGVVTMTLNPKVSQHSFVRSLHLNQRSARVWTNLGALYLMHEDKELANEAFTLAQSIDPEYSLAWLGQGLLALLYNQVDEAEGLFAHAFEISNSSASLVKKQYVLSVFDALKAARGKIKQFRVADLLSPFFAVQKLTSQTTHPSPSSTPYKHLKAQFAERLGLFDEAIDTLISLTEHLETSYEEDESPQTLFQYACSTADLARSQFASQLHSDAIASASTALDLSSSLLDGTLPTNLSAKIQIIRLSSHLTLGLSHFFLHHVDSNESTHIASSVDAFSTALSEAKAMTASATLDNTSADLICSLAQVLWAKGGDDEKNVAREQLYSILETNPDHVNAICLLGAIAVLDSDEDALEAVKGDLESFETNNDIPDSQRKKVSSLLTLISELSFADPTTSTTDSNDLHRTANTTTTIMLSPANLTAWSQLAQTTSSSRFPSLFAKMTALHSVPPHGDLTATQLAEILAGTGRRADAVLGIMVDPGCSAGWKSLGESLQR